MDAAIANGEFLLTHLRRDARIGRTPRVSVALKEHGPEAQCVLVEAFWARLGFYGNLDSAVFLRDLVAGTTEPVSVGPHGVLRPATDPAISGDGRVIVFASDFGGLVSGQPNKHELEEVYERASRR